MEPLGRCLRPGHEGLGLPAGLPDRTLQRSHELFIEQGSFLLKLRLEFPPEEFTPVTQLPLEGGDLPADLPFFSYDFGQKFITHLVYFPRRRRVKIFLILTNYLPSAREVISFLIEPAASCNARTNRTAPVDSRNDKNDQINNHVLKILTYPAAYGKRYTPYSSVIKYLTGLRPAPGGSSWQSLSN